jgi:type IV secretion system protein VirB10
MMAQGKLIDCVLDTAISTVVAGMAKCSLTRDVYGEDGKVVLLDRGTELTGEYRSNLRVGQTRLGIIWNRAKTPTGVVIALTSPATDSLGRAGVDGYLDTHFWERYGASIMLSSLDDALAIIANRARDNGTVYIPPNINRTGRDAAAVALEQNIRIPPTIVKNQGEHIAVSVARDLDFRTVYGYRAAPGAGH